MPTIELDLPGARRHYAGDIALTQDANRTLFDIWSARTASGAAFTRADFDPLTLPAKIIPHLMLLRAEQDDAGNPRLRYTLSGTHLDQHYHEPLTGRCVDELETQNWKCFWNSSYALALVDNRPVKGLVSIGWQEREHILAEYVFLPMSYTGAEIDSLACSVVFFQAGGGRFPDLLETPPF